MALCPDFSDSDSNLSDDGDYYNFKEQMKANRKNITEQQTHILTASEQKEQQLKNLFHVLANGNVEDVTKLLDNGLDVNVNVEDGWTPLLLTVSYGNSQLSNELIKRGADVNCKRDECTALMMACNCPNETSPFEQSLAIIKRLVENGADVNAINRRRITPLMFAANTGNLGAVKYLLPLSNKNAEDNQKWTALFWAVSANKVEVVKYLLEEGLEYNMFDVRNNTLLDIAKNYNFTNVIQLFPKDENDFISDIVGAHIYSYEDTFSNLKPGQKPKFFLDVCNILCAVRSESIAKTIADKGITLSQFLSISDDELISLGVKLPYQRNRILGGLYRYHKHPYHPKSLHVVPLKETYSNIDMAVQLISTIKQLIAMEASLVYILKHYDGHDIEEAEKSSITANIKSIKIKIRMCKNVMKKLAQKTTQLDNQVKSVDLITANSRKYLLPCRKIIFTFSVVSLIFAFKMLK